MTTLTQKRANSQLNSIGVHHDTSMNAKLDKVILNTSHNLFITTLTTTIEANGIFETSSTDLGNNSAIHTIQIVGDTTDENLDITLHVSIDNIIFYNMPNVLISTYGSSIFGQGNINFNYFKIVVNNNAAIPVTINMISNAKNIT